MGTEEGKNEFEILKLYYTNISENLRFFVEWRFKSISRYIITLTGLFAAVGWMFKSCDTNKSWFHWLFLPFIIISIVSYIFFRLEIRNSNIQNNLVKNGLKIEKNLSNYEGFYNAIEDPLINRHRAFMLKSAYLGICFASFIIAIVLFIKLTLQ